MPWIVELIVTWIVVAVSLLIISKLPLGIEIDSFKKALISAAVFGILNAVLQPILRAVFFIPNVLTLFLLEFVFAAIINAIIFGLAATLVPGFRLRGGVLSALIGAIVLGLLNSLMLQLFNSVS